MAKLEEVNVYGVLGIGVGVGLGIGSALGYAVTKRKLETKFACIAEQEIAEMREHYSKAKAIVSEPKPELAEVVEELGYATVDDTFDEPEPEEVVLVEEEPAVRNVFDSTEWDYAKEMRNRDETRPYVIHIDEFVQGERDYEQTTLTYFADDDVLCDERDSVVDNRDEMIGLENLERFGHGSGDPNTLYIRNPPLSLDIEIVRSEGNYAAEVHGFIEHSDSGRRVKSRRGFDDDEFS